jgi:opacity protein-like surface antigen
MKKFLLASVVVFALMALACAQDNNNGNTITVTKTEPVVQTVQSINVAKETVRWPHPHHPLSSSTSSLQLLGLVWRATYPSYLHPTTNRPTPSRRSPRTSSLK